MNGEMEETNHHKRQAATALDDYGDGMPEQHYSAAKARRTDFIEHDFQCDLHNDTNYNNSDLVHLGEKEDATETYIQAPNPSHKEDHHQENKGCNEEMLHLPSEQQQNQNHDTCLHQDLPVLHQDSSNEEAASLMIPAISHHHSQYPTDLLLVPEQQQPQQQQHVHCKRCERGPSYHHGHAKDCPKSKYYRGVAFQAGCKRCVKGPSYHHGHSKDCHKSKYYTRQGPVMPSSSLAAANHLQHHHHHHPIDVVE
jgi:hypothetical protein